MNKEELKKLYSNAKKIGCKCINCDGDIVKNPPEREEYTVYNRLSNHNVCSPYRCKGCGIFYEHVGPHNEETNRSVAIGIGNLNEYFDLVSKEAKCDCCEKMKPKVLIGVNDLQEHECNDCMDVYNSVSK